MRAPHASRLKLAPGPADVAGHPRKWSPPPPQDGIPLDERPEWLRDEALPFLELFERNVRKFPSKAAVTWVEEKGVIKQSYTYEEVFQVWQRRRLQSFVLPLPTHTPLLRALPAIPIPTPPQLDALSRAVSASLVGEWGAGRGDRVVLLYPPGLDFLIAFIACLRSGVVAVPVYPPNPRELKKDVEKLTRLVNDCGARIVLSTSEYRSKIRLSLLKLVRWPGEHWYNTNGIKPLPRSAAENGSSSSENGTLGGSSYSSDEIAFLQYTSGSTADPKGVMITHTNIAHNVMFIRRTLRMHSGIRFFSWLPQYHDLGLIVAYLSTLTAGGSGVYMSPIDFIHRPASWLQWMSRLKITHTAAPNFALNLATRKFVPSRDAALPAHFLSASLPPSSFPAPLNPSSSPSTALNASAALPTTLDLSSLECFLNAAEPVRPEAIERWNAVLGRYGWDLCGMCPCYGLAEHVVGVSGWGSKLLHLPDITLHSSGHLATYPVDGRVVIVNPETHEACAEGEEGEIWARSCHVARGYWGKPELSEETFRARMKEGSDAGLYLRTGDLGLVVAQQLFITGRIKDLIIVGGKNYYPQDIELTVEAVSDSIRPGCCAAFSVNKTSHGVAAGGKGDTGEKGEEEEVLAVVVEIPKTTSGKIRRKETSHRLTTGALTVLNSNSHTEGGAGETIESLHSIPESSGAKGGGEDVVIVEEKRSAEVPQKEVLVGEEARESEEREEATSGKVEEEEGQVEGKGASEKESVGVEEGEDLDEASDMAAAGAGAGVTVGAGVQSEGADDAEEGEVVATPTAVASDETAAAAAEGDVAGALTEEDGQSKAPVGDGAVEAEEGAEEDMGAAKWDGMGVESAVKAIMGIHDLEIAGEPLLIDIGLTSMNGMEVLELLERPYGRLKTQNTTVSVPCISSQDLEIAGEPLLIDIGLTSMNGMEVLELLERPSGRLKTQNTTVSVPCISSQDLEIAGESLLIDIGLTSMNGMEVLELLERRCDRRLVVDDMEVS
ncbi:unnamed protein product [Closterium sp. NIES-65]|nr:unnamed protein product [Closterium sp. NIES-65]